MVIKPKATHLASRVRLHYLIYPFLIYTENTNPRLSLINIEGDVDCHRSAVYLHIIWNLENDEDDFFLYVGQSRDLAKRLSDHMNPLWRTKHSSLHYYAWDSRPENLSAWVVLAYLDEPTNFSTGTKLVIGKDDQLKMNSVEL